MKQKFTVTAAKRLTPSEVELLSELYRIACEGDEWNPQETDFTPVRVNGSVGFDNGFGYIFTSDGEGYLYNVDSDKTPVAYTV